ncbi:MAG: very short patch repair endonuclease, partial [Acidimicrobiales bacterium]
MLCVADYPPEVRSRVMARVRSRDTGPERRVRSLLHRAGLRFRVARRLELSGFKVAPDIVFGPARVAVFIDGCFWHRCPEHGSVPVKNREYWLPKLERNEARDRRADRALAEAGWAVVRVWEHTSPDEAAARI